jgi:hypothetical protein
MRAMTSAVIFRRFNAIAVWLVGVAFSTAAISKALNLPPFHEQITKYNLIPLRLVGAAAVTLILLEAGLGLCCIVGVGYRKAVLGILILLVLFTSATILRWTALQGTDCNCFGNLGGGGPATTLVRNIGLACVGGLILFGAKGHKIVCSHRWLRLALAVIAITAALLIARPASGGYAFLESGGERGPHVRVFLSATCKRCQESLVKVQELASSPEAPPVRIFIGAENELQISEFLHDAAPRLTYFPVTFNQMAKVVTRVPTVQLLDGSTVQREWSNDVPGADEVIRVMREHSYLK